MSKRRPGSRHYQALHRRRWEAVRLSVLERDGWRCTRCGKPGKLEVHHKQTLAAGGSPYDPANLETNCRECHIDLHRTASATPGREAWIEFVKELTR